MPVRSLRPPAWLLAILSGLLLAPAFPAASWGPLAFGAFVPVLIALVRERRGFWPSFRLGWLFGFAFFVVLLYWIPRLPPENVTVPLLLYPALVLAGLYCGIYVAAWGGVVGWLARGRPAAIALLAPGFWVPIEIVRSSGVLGFPWGVIGGSQWTALDWIQAASIGGVHLLSFLIVLVNGCLAAALLSPGWRRPAWLAGALLLMVLPWQWGKGERARWEEAMPMIPTVPVVLIQPNTGYDKWNAERRTAIITGLVQSTLEAARVTRDSTMIIWPETAAPTLLKWDEPNMALVRNAAEVTGRPLVTGFPDRTLDFPPETGGAARVRYYNVAGLF
ncbi:MAG TPA: apolipoprotein N-acyltransferase, partial [Candidatus Eisenbacteria bacterium]